MRIMFFGNNRAATRILRSLVDGGESVVAMALHEPDDALYREELLELAALPPDSVFEAPQLTEPGAADRLRELGVEVGVCAFFGHILRAPIIRAIPAGIVNVHPSLLPYNRGAYPNVWSIIDGTPAGTTIHYIDEGVDTGEIVAQKEVEVEVVDTGATLYRKLETACVELFRETWPAIRRGEASRSPQPPGMGTHHRRSDVEQVDAIDPDREYRASDLIDLLRARTFRPHSGAYFLDDRGRRVFVRISLEYEKVP